LARAPIGASPPQRDGDPVAIGTWRSLHSVILGEDSPALDESFFTRPFADWPPSKETITIRLDADVLSWFRRGGRGYQSRINRMLRLFVQAQGNGRTRRRRRSRPAAS
jgi:uncharacterized protein (DUF4415 family)